MSSSAAPAVASTSHEVPSLDVPDAMDSQANILEEMEMSAAEQELTTSSQKRRRRKRDEDSPEEEQCWMKELRLTMKANQALLEKLLEERSQRQSDREPFIHYISEMLRNVPQEQYVALSEGFLDLVRARGQRRDSQGWTRPGGTHSTHPYLYPQQQQHYYQPQPFQDQSSSWQLGGYQPQGTQPPLQTPRRTRDSVESVGRLLAANIGEDWNNPPAITGSQDSPTIRQMEETPSDDTD